jgi:predicted MPP superfamily phosphohydrolase
MALALAFFAVFGHVFLWVGLVNRLHARALPRPLIKNLTLAFFLLMGAGPLLFFVWLSAGWENPFANWNAAIYFHPGRLLFAIYCAICWIAGIATIAFRLLEKAFFLWPPKNLRGYRRHYAAIRHGGTLQGWRARLPGNQALQLEIAEREIYLPRLPAGLDGLKILHLSDWHFTGRIGKEYYQELVRASNELQPDLTALTGDYADCDWCIDWVPETLGRLSARHGVYYVLGNHDIYIDTERLRRTMNGCGLVDLGGRSLRLEIRGESLLLAGNELPWIAPAADLSRTGPPLAEGGAARILLAHTPDQIEWARAFDIDLMLCGHTHGGQIRLPWVGAIFAPSRQGVKFDCGVFEFMPTVLHVTRGIAGKLPLRWNCAPEIVLLTLRSPKK